MRRAQIEMMGLVMVVILVTIGIFFSVAINKPPTEKAPLDVYSDEELASNFLITLLETETLCGPTMRELATDCVRPRGGKQRLYRCGGYDSCDLFEGVSWYIINSSLERWGFDYNFTFDYRPGGELPPEQLLPVGHLSKGSCNDKTVQSAPGVQPIPLFRIAPGEAFVMLRICS